MQHPDQSGLTAHNLTANSGCNVSLGDGFIQHSLSFGPLSAQNLMFIPSNIGQFGVMQQQSHFLHGSGNHVAQNSEEDKRSKFHKEREMEHQKQKFQQAFSQVKNKQDAQVQRDAMIAQMIGPLPSAKQNDVHFETQTASNGNQNVSSHSTFSKLNSDKKINAQSNPKTLQSASLQLAPDDLERLMRKYYDLNVEPKAQGFVKPTLNNIPNSATNSSAQVFSSDSNAANWNLNNTKNLEGVFVVHSNQPQLGSSAYLSAVLPNAFSIWKPFPHWLADPGAIPNEYVKLLHSCFTANRFDEIPDTGLVYYLLRTSGLSNEILGAIWSLVNRSQPGQLTKMEFFAALALVAYVQKTNLMPTLDVFDNIPSPIIPTFLTPDPAAQFQQQQTTASISAPTPALLSNSTTSVNKDVFNIRPPPVCADSNKTNNVSQNDQKTEKMTKAVSLDNRCAFTDPYDRLVDFEKSANLSKTLKNSVSENNTFVFQNGINELSTTYQFEKCDKIRVDKKIQEVDFSATLFENGKCSAATDNGAPEITNLVGLNDLDYSNVAKMVFCKAAFDSPDSGSLHSKEPSLHSLDLKSVLTIDSCDENKEAEFEVNASDSSRMENGYNSALSAGNENTFYDRYAAVRECATVMSEDRHIDAWTKVLDACLRIFQECCENFEKASTTSVCKEIVNSERGSLYLKSITEVYKVYRRISISIKTNALPTEQVVGLLSDIENAWESLCSFVAFSDLLSSTETLSFDNPLLKSDFEGDQTKACGICLLDANISNDLSNASKVITYSGRLYHSQCANFWVNCVDSLLPALKIPNLL